MKTAARLHMRTPGGDSRQLQRPAVRAGGDARSAKVGGRCGGQGQGGGQAARGEHAARRRAVQQRRGRAPRSQRAAPGLRAVVRRLQLAR